jgi:dihydroneopterin aldolase
MAKIGLEGMKFHSFHGYYAEEQSVGNQYAVDVWIETDLHPEHLGDALENTINYEEIYRICRHEMNVPRRLIETVAQSMVQQLRSRFSMAEIIKVRIKKMHPLLGGLVNAAIVEIKG